MTVRVITGTGTDVGKTIVTAALAAAAAGSGQTVAVVKPAQTGVGEGDPGDLAEVRRLSGVTDLHEFVRYPDPLSPHHAAAISRRPTLDRKEATARISALAETHDLVLVEGAGGVLVPFDEPGGWTVLDLARDLSAGTSADTLDTSAEVGVVLVTRPGLGTLNDTQLAVDRIGVADVVIGWWPESPDLAMRCNLADLAAMSRHGRLAGVLPAGAAGVEDFAGTARASLAAHLGGTFDPAAFLDRHRP